MFRRHALLYPTRYGQALAQERDQTTQVRTAFSPITKQITRPDDRGKQRLQVRNEVKKERPVSGFKATAPVGLHSLLTITCRLLIAKQSPNEETSTAYCLISKVLNLMQPRNAVVLRQRPFRCLTQPVTTPESKFTQMPCLA